MLIFKKEWRETAWSWVIALAVLTAFVAWQIAFYQWAKTLDLSDLPDEMLSQFGTLRIEYKTIVAQWFDGALVYISFAFAMLLGASSVGREKSRETLSLLLAKPIRRETILLEKYAALGAGLFLLIQLPSVVLYLAARLQNESVSWLGLGAAGVHVFTGALLVSSYAFLFSVLMSDHMKSTSAALGLTFFLALLNSNGFTARFSPFSYITPSAALQGEAAWGGLLGVLALTIAILALACYCLRRQDI